MKIELNKTPVYLLVIGLQFIVIAAIVAWGGYRFYQLDQSWEKYSARLQTDHQAELKMLTETHESALSDLEAQALAARRSSYAEGYWRAFYNICYGYYRNPGGCTQVAIRGYRNETHFEAAQPGWNWTRIKRNGLNIQ